MIRLKNLDHAADAARRMNKNAAAMLLDHAAEAVEDVGVRNSLRAAAVTIMRGQYRAALGDLQRNDVVRKEVPLSVWLWLGGTVICVKDAATLKRATGDA